MPAMPGESMPGESMTAESPKAMPDVRCEMGVVEVPMIVEVPVTAEIKGKGIVVRISAIGIVGVRVRRDPVSRRCCACGKRKPCTQQKRCCADGYSVAAHCSSRSSESPGNVCVGHSIQTPVPAKDLCIWRTNWLRRSGYQLVEIDRQRPNPRADRWTEGPVRNKCFDRRSNGPPFVMIQTARFKT
jgi:hypothetical protein